MGRGLKLRRYDTIFEEYNVQTVRDDRRRVANLRTETELARYVQSSRSGAVRDELFQQRLINFDGDDVKVDRVQVQKRIQQIRESTVADRYYDFDYFQRQYDDVAQEQNISRRQARNLRNRQYQIEAAAVLAAANAGDVKISAYDKGILNKLAAGDYESAVYGKEDNSGKRRYERGRYFTELGYAERERKRERGLKGETTKGRRDAQRRDFLEYTGGGRVGSLDNLKPFGNLGKTSKKKQEDELEDLPF